MEAKYFQRAKAYELKVDLANAKRDGKTSKRKSILKRIIANMTMGNDMSGLYHEVISINSSFPNVEVKRLVYLYVINYARSKPDMVPPFVQALRRDCSDANPIVRALALKTFCTINPLKETDVLAECIQKAIKDASSQVRKAAALGIVQLLNIDIEQFTQGKFREALTTKLLYDESVEVVANAAIALREVVEATGDLEEAIDMNLAQRLSSILLKCHEWGQTYVMEILLYFKPTKEDDALAVLDDVFKCLSHANYGVRTTAIRVALYLVNYIRTPESRMQVLKRVTSPLVSLWQGPPEVKYISLKNSLMIVRKFPETLRPSIHDLFCKYDDPIFVKKAKLEMMLMLVDESNINTILSELEEYATEIDVDFAKSSVRAIGTCALRVESNASDCVEKLMALLDMKVSYIVQEVLIVMKDILRRYPEDFVDYIPRLCQSVDSAIVDEARAAMIWMVGEHSKMISNAQQLLEDLFQDMADESLTVQLTYLTACIKFVLVEPSLGHELIGRVLRWCTQEVDNPDLRERGLMYWRLLTNDPKSTKAIVFGPKPAVEADIGRPRNALLEKIVLNMGTMGSLSACPQHSVLNGSLSAYCDLDENVDKYQTDLLTESSGDHQANNRHFDGAIKSLPQGIGAADLLGESTGSYPNRDLVGLEESFAAVTVSGTASEGTDPRYSNLLLSTDLPAQEFYSSQGTEPFQPVGSEPLYISTGTPVKRSSDPQTYFDNSLRILDGTASNEAFSAPTSAKPGNWSPASGRLSSEGSVPITSPTALVATSPDQSQSVTKAKGTSNLRSELASLTADHLSFMNFESQPSPPKQIWLTSQQGKGLEVRGAFVRRRRKIIMEMQIVNRALQNLTDFAIQFNSNSFGLRPGEFALRQLEPNAPTDLKVEINVDPSRQAQSQPLNNLQVAIKTNAGISYFQTLMPLYVCFSEDGFSFPKAEFLRLWREIPDDQHAGVHIDNLDFKSSREMIEHLMSYGVFSVAERIVKEQTVIYLVIVLINDHQILLECRPTGDFKSAVLFFKSKHVEYMSLLEEAMTQIMVKSGFKEPVMQLDPNVVQQQSTMFPHRLDQHIMMQQHGPAVHTMQQTGGHIANGLMYQPVGMVQQPQALPQPTFLAQMQGQQPFGQQPVGYPSALQHHVPQMSQMQPQYQNSPQQPAHFGAQPPISQGVIQDPSQQFVQQANSNMAPSGNASLPQRDLFASLMNLGPQ